MLEFMKWVKTSQIRYNPENPRTIKGERFAKLKRSLIEFPEMLEARTLVCITRDDGKFQVIGGNQRLRALNDIGADEVPVFLAEHWTPEQRERFVIADNVNFGDWDFDELANKWGEEQLAAWGVDIPTEKETELEMKECCPTCGK
jgi:ParB-like chromosome segregation protein Spo0J